ncbi:Uncharacterised protein [Neisseria zoodegmatis]|uniref:J domain-containing protein n=1 Tax=Neisseria zoodegmatis TaxID=326523 RepID=A0AB38DMK4_9NEIS|nr:hypothetical protein [Neisseria zoodegmatis]OSI09291.1 hypothetical protein BWD10_10220 [Neisseria zoodegmatis]SNU78670.1 Uncharacterised protein [Neisseria zoodegmatis]
MKNYYEILGVNITADSEEIRKAMQKMAESGRISLSDLQVCKENLLDEEARKAYNKNLFMEQPQLLEKVALEANQKFKGETQAVEAENIVEPKQQPPQMSWVQIIGGGFLVLFFGMIVFGKSDNKTPKLDEWIAQAACESAVKQLLKAPATAEFGGWGRNRNGDGTYTITGSVDAHNSYGAMLRSSFNCTVRDKGDGNTGTVVNYLK